MTVAALVLAWGVLDRVCRSPLGSVCSVRQAVAGTFMDVLQRMADSRHGLPVGQRRYP